MAQESPEIYLFEFVSMSKTFYYRAGKDEIG